MTEIHPFFTCIFLIFASSFTTCSGTGCSQQPKNAGRCFSLCGELGSQVLMPPQHGTGGGFFIFDPDGTDCNVKKINFNSSCCWSKDIIHVEPDTFGNHTQLETLIFANNQLTSLNSSWLDDNPSLTYLDFHFNSISDIAIGAFHTNLGSLKYLNLAHNSLSNLDVDIFKTLTSLEFLDLSYNSNLGSNLSVGIFDSLTSLTTLKIGSLKLSTLNPNLFKNNIKLTELVIDDNKLSYIKQGTFDNNVNLLDLSAEENQLQNDALPNNLFLNVKGPMKSVSFKNNIQMKKLRPGIIAFFTNKVYSPGLDLDFPLSSYKDCQLSFYIEDKTLKKIANTSVTDDCTELDFDTNTEQITYLQDNVFDSMPDLNKLNLRNNNITRLPEHVFKYNTKLKIDNNLFLDAKTKCSILGFDISNDNRTLFRKTDPEYSYMNTCESLDLSNYLINHLDKESFANMTKLKFLDLSKNNLTFIHPETFNDAVALDAYSNLVLDDKTKCTMLAFKVINGELTRRATPYYNLKTCRKLDFSGSRIRTIAKDSLKETPNLKILQLKENLISNVSAAIPTNVDTEQLEVIYLQNNQIQEIEQNSFSDFKKLREINLNTNIINNIHAKAFSSNTKLNSLSLENNKLTELASGTFAVFKSTSNLTLNNNTIQCCVSITEIVELQRKNQFLQCALEQNIFIDSSQMKKLTEVVSSCNGQIANAADVNDNKSSSLFIIVGAVVGVVVLIAVVVVIVVIVFKRRRKSDLLKGQTAKDFVMDSKVELRTDNGSGVDYSIPVTKQAEKDPESTQKGVGTTEIEVQQYHNAIVKTVVGNEIETPQYQNVILRTEDDSAYFTLQKENIVRETRPNQETGKYDPGNFDGQGIKEKDPEPEYWQGNEENEQEYWQGNEENEQEYWQGNEENEQEYWQGE